MKRLVDRMYFNIKKKGYISLSDLYRTFYRSSKIEREKALQYLLDNKFVEQYTFNEDMLKRKPSTYLKIRG